MANSSSGDSVTDRLVRVLETFTPTRTVQTAAEIGRRAGLPTSSAHRIVGELVDAGLLERDDDRRIRIGTRLWELATRSSQALRLRQAAMPAMERVQARVREHTQLAILEQDEALFLERLSGRDSGSNVTRIAGRLPLHASSSGLVLLAFGDRDLQERILAAPLVPLTRETITDPAALRSKLAEVR
ncbi:MAG: helix-turn-helix domain-containing protein, partial [Microbacterium sp.]